MKLIRTNSNNKDFADLVIQLDKELTIRDGSDHAFYHQFNSIDDIPFVVVLTLNEVPVGCGALKPLSDYQMEVKRVFVKESKRGNKLAVAIMRELETWTKELGYTHCQLETGINQPEAIRLYEKCKYKRIENYGQYAGLKTSLCFEKKV